ncbi:MAG: GAF domain-containing protein [Crocinitomicaceae bacterium]|nr:GAF domain-containing protein [Crocinitomicaceae bacterium]
MKVTKSHHLKSFLIIALFLGIVISPFDCHGQNRNEQKVDSLITILITLDKSEKKADVLNEIARLTLKDDFEKALNYAQRSLAIAEELDYKTGILRASSTLGNIYTNYYLDYFEGKQHLSVALEIAEGLDAGPLQMSVFQDYGYLMHMMGNCNYSINYYRKAIKIAEEFKNYDKLAELYAYVADVYLDCGDKKNAVDHYSLTYALFNSKKIREIHPQVYLSSAKYLRIKGDHKEAKEIYKDAILTFKTNKLPRFESFAYSQLAQTELISGDYYSAKNSVNTGLEIANKNYLIREKLANYEVQVSIYDSIGDYKKTYISLIKYTKLKDSLSTAQFREQNRKFQTNYEEMLNKNKFEKLKEQQLNHQLELENQRLNRNIIIGILCFVTILVILMILRLRYIRKKEREMKVLTLATSHTTNSIILFDKNICVEWVNRGFERLTGLALEEVKGKYFLEFYNGPELGTSKIEEFKNNFLSGKAFTMEMTSYHHETDEDFRISISVTPLYEGEFLKGYVSVATDITALHNAQVELQKVHDETILLNEIGRQITSTLSVSEIIEKVYENVNKLMDAQNLGIGIYVEDKNEIFFPEPIEKGNKLKSFSYSVDKSDRLAIQCFRDNKEIRVGSIEEIEMLTGVVPSPLEGDQPESVIYVPLISKWKTMGVISVQSFSKTAYGVKEMDMVRTLATYVAIAMENAGLYENMEEIVEERTKEVIKQKEQLETNFANIKLLSEIGVEIASSLNFEDVFETLYEAVAKMMDAEIFGVRLYHEDKNEIEYKYEIESGKRDPVISVSMDDKANYSVWCVEHRKEILISDNLKEYNKYINDLVVPSGGMPSSLIFYPMIAEGRVFGVITVQSFKKNAYTPYHVAMVKTLSAYTAEALSNAEMIDTLEHKVQERTKELAQKNKDILASINYAKRIQRGILPTDSFMSSLLPESFVLYRPRDIISGDFYWVERSQGKVFFAVVDCTGHGVPGALMSIIGKNILDQAVNEKDIDDPSMILTYLRAGLRVAFSADETLEGTEVEDGMDLGVCVWDQKKNTVNFAGANSNLYLVHDGALEIVKGDKTGVSASNFDMRNYSSHEFDILEGDIIYLSSDGYPDQFGGDRMKKYSQRRFQELLLRLSALPINTQLDELEQELESWMREYDQLDDICVMGVKF